MKTLFISKSDIFKWDIFPGWYTKMAPFRKADVNILSTVQVIQTLIGNLENYYFFNFLLPHPL